MGWESKVPAASNGDGDFEIPEPGNHIAAMVGLIDLGSHEQTFEGQSQGWRRRVYLVWELLAEQKSDGSPFYIGREFTLSYHEKAAFRQWLEKWRAAKYQPGETINPAAALGRLCLLTVVRKANRDGTRTYAIAESIGGVPKGTPPPRKPTRPPLAWQIADTAEERARNKPPEDEWLPYSFGSLLADVIRTSPEWNGQPVPKPVRQKPSNGQEGGGVTDAARAIGAAQGDACEDEVTIF